MNKPFLPSFLLFFSGLLLLSSCNPTRKIIKEPLKEQGSDYIFQNLKKNELSFNYLTASFSVSYIADKKKISLNGQIRIVKDSAIWISLSPALGIEMARVLITPDSVKFMNRMDNTFFLSDFQYMDKFINNAIDFDMLQAMIIGNDLCYYENNKFKASVENQQYKLSTIGRQKLKRYIRHKNEALIVLIQNIWINPDNFKIEKINVKEIKAENKKLEADFSDFLQVDNQFFPTKIMYTIEAERNINIGLRYTKVKINEPHKISFRIPDNYTQIK